MKNSKNPVQPKMVHSTYFTLPMGSTPQNVASYLAAAQAYLYNPDFMESFWIGSLAQDIFRSSSDRSFNVSMNQVFSSLEMFQKYAAFDVNSPYIGEVNRWAPMTSRRVMDSFLFHLLHQPIGPIPPGSPRMIHNLYFALTDNSAEGVKEFSDICLKYLSGHPGENLFAIGELANLKRNVSISNYDVAMTTTWQNTTVYGNYEASKRHQEFFKASAGMIKNTYIFDSYITETPKPVKSPKSKKLIKKPLP